MLLYLVNGYHNTPKEKKLCKIHFPETESLIYKMKVEKGLKGKKIEWIMLNQIIKHLLVSTYDTKYCDMNWQDGCSFYLHTTLTIYTVKCWTTQYSPQKGKRTIDLTIVEVWSESNANHIGLDTQIFDIYILFVQFGTDQHKINNAIAWRATKRMSCFTRSPIIQNCYFEFKKRRYISFR